jgi:hypothetical protein
MVKKAQKGFPLILSHCLEDVNWQKLEILTGPAI